MLELFLAASAMADPYLELAPPPQNPSIDLSARVPSNYLSNSLHGLHTNLEHANVGGLTIPDANIIGVQVLDDHYSKFQNIKAKKPVFEAGIMYSLLDSDVVERKFRFRVVLNGVLHDHLERIQSYAVGIRDD
ncbi:hypothetical protein ACH5RR_037078 [Cinchona calisaya]|uniref:Uncharacterized protein n=1 Tax=Cinchona calisaya TaxID=153742 RepID=A0ABD2Y8R5_9GENT